MALGITVDELKYDNPFFTPWEEQYHEYEYFTAGTSNWHYCGHCGLWHDGPCPRIKAIEYYPNGSIKRIEYGGVGPS